MTTETAIATIESPVEILARADAPALERYVTRLRQRMASLAVIDGPDTYLEAAELLKTATIYIKGVHEFMDSICEDTDKAHKTATAKRARLLDPALDGKKILGGSMADYDQEQDRRRRQAEETAQRERTRLEAEAQAAADIEQQRLQVDAEDRQLAAALDADARGDTAAAAKIIEAPISVPTVIPAAVFTPPVTVAPAPRVDGISFRTDYSAQLTDLAAVVTAAAVGNTVALSCLTFDQVRANQLARSLKMAMRVPGIKVLERRITATKAS